MKVSEWSKKQTILIGVLVGVLLCAILFLVAVATRPAAPTLLDEPDDEADIELIEEGAVSLKTEATPPPDLSLIFRPDSEHPLPEDRAVLALGGDYTIGGTVYSNYPLDNVTVTITCSHNNQKPYPYKKAVHFKQKVVGVYDLADAATDEGVSLSSLVDFSELLVGVHTLKITASVKGTHAVEMARCTFYVLGEEWETITKDKFPDSYPEALKFFGSEERFLYRYQWVNGRYTVADPEWEKTYITEIPGYPDNMPWLVHIDAVPYMEKAFEYLENTYIRVHGTNGDTGVIKTIALITEYNGCYVSRFTSSLKAVSHHTFGTAVDLNASMEPNKNNAKNHAVIDDDVKGHLVYNGILTENDVRYYDFTYDGKYKLDPNGVPETCVNYLLYEFGFFRAGFDWAHYYKSTSDAMHFCLSEFVTHKHDDKTYGLRKVYEYIEDAPETPSPEPTVPPVLKP
ncbi:MAG: M15 family metallopeptidase [Clostridia bacterium]|nr:M15 family metallopeptidase [Clostridia bacterium]